MNSSIVVLGRRIQQSTSGTWIPWNRSAQLTICGDGIMVELVLLQLLSRWSVTQQVTRRVSQATDVKMLSLSLSSVKPQP